jgi:RNA recognition motif-containing protein
MSNDQYNIDNINYDESSNDNKIFVGNVPYQCTKEEFQNCFKHLNGFITADIKRRHNSKLSRGFGFVIFDSQHNAKQLLSINDITLKDRTLRFSPYSFNDNDDIKQFKLFLPDIDEDMTNEDLTNLLSKYGTITECIINNKNNRTFGIICFDNYDSFINCLNDNITYNDRELIVKPYKKVKFKNKQFFSNPILAYRKGLQAGKIIGFQEGFQEGLKSRDNVNPS